MSTEPEARKELALITHLKGLARNKDRAALAALRRGLGRKPGEVTAMLPHVVPYAPHYGEDTTFLVASLFGWHPCIDHGLPMGSVMRRVWIARNRTESIEQRFTSLLNAHRDDLPHHLRQAISLAKSTEVPVDYDRLFGNINNWDHEKRFVQLEWARQFWGEPSSQTEPDSEVETTEQS
jgi:CRISPR system Cascade subunit CasB